MKTSVKDIAGSCRELGESSRCKQAENPRALQLNQQIPNNMTDEGVRELWRALALCISQRAPGVISAMYFRQSKSLLWQIGGSTKCYLEV